MDMFVFLVMKTFSSLFYFDFAFLTLHRIGFLKSVSFPMKQSDLSQNTSSLFARSHPNSPPALRFLFSKIF